MKRTPASTVARRMSDDQVARAMTRLNIYERDLATFIRIEASARGINGGSRDA